MFWLGSAFYLQAPSFGWSLAAVRPVAVAGAVSALAAPLFGRAAGIAGAHRARTAAFAAMSLGWVLLALFRHSLTGMAVGLVILDIGAVVADI